MQTTSPSNDDRAKEDILRTHAELLEDGWQHTFGGG